ncbi:MAG: hypothetical protein KAY37_01075 [Phycisphaerae bacterium]|nr:hypothetical protein [Phycisphaerae bacterium]
MNEYEFIGWICVLLITGLALIVLCMLPGHMHRQERRSREQTDLLRMIASQGKKLRIQNSEDRDRQPPDIPDPQSVQPGTALVRCSRCDQELRPGQACPRCG